MIRSNIPNNIGVSDKKYALNGVLPDSPSISGSLTILQKAIKSNPIKIDNIPIRFKAVVYFLKYHTYSAFFLGLLTFFGSGFPRVTNTFITFSKLPNFSTKNSRRST